MLLAKDYIATDHLYSIILYIKDNLFDFFFSIECLFTRFEKKEQYSKRIFHRDYYMNYANIVNEFCIIIISQIMKNGVF